MNMSKWGIGALSLVLTGAVAFAADDAVKSAASDNARDAAPAARAPKAGGPAKARQVRLTKPWKDLTSLTDEQKRQISDIHRKAVQDKNAVERRERDDIMALLNDSQKADLKAMLDKQAAERKARAATNAAKQSAAGEKASDGDSDENASSAAESASDKKDAAAPAK